MEKDKFVMKWEKTRAKGRMQYVFIHGAVIWGLISGAIFLFITILIQKQIKIDFELTEYLHSGKFILWIIVSFTLFPLAGMLQSLSTWKSNERKYNRLRRYY